MNDEIFAELDRIQETGGPADVLAQLALRLQEQKEYHRLFDVLLMQRRHAMGLGLVQPTRFDDVPPEQQDAFEEVYVEAAREIGDLFLQDGDIPQAWLYLRTIREPQRVKAALDALEPPFEPSDLTEQLIRIALFEGAHPVKGLELMLRTHGTCNTITSFDQSAQQMTPEARRQAAGLLVRELYSDLSHTVRRIVEEQEPNQPADASLTDLIEGRNWLFEGGGYHIDFSHLHSVVRFARLLESGDAELPQAIALADYGTHLDAQFQYAGDPPFQDFYRAHLEFLRALAGIEQDAALASFRDQLQNAEEDDRRLIAYAFVDLLKRCGRMDEALDVAEQHLKSLDPATGFSFAQLCKDAGRLDVLRAVARESGDVVTYAAALLQAEPSTAGAGR